MSALTGCEPILTALDGREPDRAGCALSFFHVDLGDSRLQSGRRSEIVDVEFVSFPVAEDEGTPRRTGEPYPPDTRLGTSARAATYARWHYQPHEPRRANPLARVQSVADLQAFPFPDV